MIRRERRYGEKESTTGNSIRRKSRYVVNESNSESTLCEKEDTARKMVSRNKSTARMKVRPERIYGEKEGTS